MSFTSPLFAFFILAFFSIWILFKNNRYIILLLSSLFFYGAWNPYYVPLLLLSSFIAYYASHAIDKNLTKNNPTLAKRWLIWGVTADLLILGYFKYSGFFIHSTMDLFKAVGLNFYVKDFEVLLPVGISFYTFQSISHTVDVYRKLIKPSKSFANFLLFESLFPHLVAGPIQKASFLLPQVERFEQGKLQATPLQKSEGIDLIIRGFLKKLLIADNLALYVSHVFSSLEQFRILTIAIATLFFTIQIYCDFSGYSDIARGLAKLMGFEFTLNFDYPYFSHSVTEFWRRWHISLSTWLRDYLYIPLGGNKGSKFFQYRNLFLTMLLGGLWHGANYTFVLWGMYQGLLLIINKVTADLKLVTSQTSLTKFFTWLTTIILVVFGWYIFRIQSVSDLLIVFKKVITPFHGANFRPSLLQVFAAFLFIGIHYYENKILKQRISIISLKPGLRVAVGLAILLISLWFTPSQYQEFIYFQF